MLLGQKNDDEFKSEKNKINVSLKGLKNKKLVSIVEAIDVARDLTMRPANILTPDALENYVKKMAKKDKNLKVKIMREKDLKKEKMNLHLAVNAGSHNEARAIIIEYNPKNLTCVGSENPYTFEK